MSRRISLSISLDECVISKIDTNRGAVPRSRFVESAVLMYLDGIKHD